MQKKNQSASKPALKANPDAKMLEKHEFHRAQAKKHEAHADLIQAKLRTQGKRITHSYDSYPGQVGKSKRKIVSDD